MFSVFQHLVGVGLSSLSLPMTFVLSEVFLQDFEKAYCRAAGTDLTIKIIFHLYYLRIKLFAMDCFGQLGPWKCLHGQSEGTLDGWLKIQPRATACRTQPGNMYQSIVNHMRSVRSI